MAQPKVVKRNSSLEIVTKNDVSLSEEVFHELEDNEAAGEEVESLGEKNGLSDSQKRGWDKIAKSVTFSAIMNAAAPPVEEGGALELSSEDFRVGVPYHFKVHLEQLPGKSLVVTCDPQYGASIKIATHEKEGIATYMCTLVPLKEGKFTVSTLLGKKNVLGSPFEVQFNQPADAGLCTMVEAPAECRTSVDKDTLTFCIRTNQDREGTLTSSAKSLTGKKTIPVNINESGKGHYDIEFDANAYDGKKYRLSVKFDNQHINGSPFLLHLSDANVCKAMGEGIKRGVVGQENHFEVVTKGAGPGKLRVKVEGKAQTVVIIKPKEDGLYEVTYFPKKVGSYSIMVMWLDEEIPGSPFLVNCYKPVGVTLPKPEKTSVYKVGETYKFRIDAKDSGEGELEAGCMDEGWAKVDVASLGKGQYRVDVTPNQTGTVRVSIRWAGQEIPGFPFHMEADIKADSSQITTPGPVYEVGSCKPVVLELNTEKGGAGKLKASCVGEKSKNVTVKVVENKSKIHLISFEPPKPDVYTLWVTWSKKQIPGSPFTINLHPSNAQNCQLVADPTVPEDWQEPAVVTISTVGAGNGKLEASAVGEKGGLLSEEHVQVRETHAAEMEIKLLAPSPDIFALSVTWGGDEIPKSPFIINRIPPNAENCVASVSRFAQNWQEDVYVYVDATAAGNGKLTALAVGNVSGDVSKHITIQPDENGLGQYVVKFSPNDPDIYTFTVEWSRKPIPGFPCQLNRNRYQPDEVEVFEPPAGLMKVGQDISIGVDASRGGPGELTSTCSAKKGGDIPAIVEKKEEYGKYKVYFTPPAEDVYSLSVFWGGEHIKGSPFTIDMVPVNASLVIASEPTYPQGLNGPVEVTLSTDDAGRAPVTALCMGGRSGRVPVSVTEISYSKYKLSFTPPQPDLFTMGVKYGNQNINSSPFHINTYPPNASLVTVTPPAETSLGESVSYFCDASNAGHGKLTATVSGKKRGVVDVDITPNGVGKFSVSFLPQEPDIYSMSIKWEGEEVPKCPFLANLLPLDPGLITVEKVQIPDEAGSEYAYVTIDCSKVGVAPLITNVLGDAVGDVSTEIKQLPNHQHSIRFIPPKDDKYTMSVLFNDGDIPGSPFVMSIISPQPEKVKLMSTDIPNQQLPPIALIFDTTEAGRGKMQASIKGENSGEVTEHQVSESTPGTWRVSFIPPSLDTYSVTCLWAKREVPHSPFTVNLGPAVASKVVVGEVHIPAEAGTGEEVWLDLDCSAAGHGVVQGTVKDASSFANGQEVEIKTLGLKRYRLKFEPKKPQLYKVTVRYGGDQVPGSPFEVDLQLCVPEGVKVKEKRTPQFSDGSEGYIILDTSNAGRGVLTAKLSAKVSHESIPLTFQEVSRKIYKIVFTPPFPDSYTFDVFWSDVPISSSPHRFNVLQPICPEKVVCGEFTCSGTGKPAEIDVSTYGAGYAQLTAVCEGEKCGGVDVKVVTSETDVDSHVITFIPPMEDVYSLSVRYCGTEIPNSPFPLDLVPRILVQENFHQKYLKTEETTLELPQAEETDSRAEKKRDEEEENNLRQFVGDPLLVNVTAEEKEQRNAPLVATATGDKTGAADIRVTKNPDGTRDVFFNPDKPDRYKINILIGESHIPGSPFVAVFQYYTDPTKCFVFDSDDLKLPIRVDQEVIFGVNATKAGIGKLEVSVNTPGRTPASYVEVSEPDIGVYYVSYTPTTAGLHQLSLTWGFGSVPDSPLQLEVRDPAVPIYRYGKPITIQLKKVQGSPSELTASATHVRTKTNCDVNIARLKKGEFMLAFEASQPGMYHVNIHRSGTEIHGSPYHVRYAPPSNASACVVSGLTSPAHIGEITDFTVDASSAGFGEILVRPEIPHSGLESAVNIRDNRNGRYLVQYTPQAVGEHCIHITWCDEPVPGSPFTLNVERQEDSEDVAHLAEGEWKLFQEPHSIKKPLKFIIVTPSECSGKLVVSSRGPGKPEIRVEDNKNGSYTCHLKSAEPGSYWIHVLWRRRHIEGSPFLLTVLPDKAIKILGLNAVSDSQQVSSVRIADDDQCIFKGPQAVETNIKFRLVTGEAGKGVLSVSCVGPGHPEVDVSDNHDGTHSCSVKVTEQSEYKVYVLWNKIHIPGSPFILTFLPSKAVKMLGLNPCRDPGLASSVKVTEEDKELFTQPQPVQPLQFSIVTSGGGKGELCVSAKGPGEISVEILESKTEGVQTCLLTPSSPGEYCMYVLWDNIHIPGSPFTVCFTPEKARKFLGFGTGNGDLTSSHLARVHVISEDLAVFAEAQSLNSPVKFHVSTKKAGKGVLTLTTQGPGKPQVKLGDVKNNVCECTIKTGIAGKYKIHLLWNNERIGVNPYQLVFESKQQQVKGIDLENIVLPLNVTHKFKVFYREVGEGEFRLFCQPSNAADVTVSPLSSGGCYHCELTPRIPGNHDLVILYNDRYVLGSPFCVHFDPGTTPHPLIFPTTPTPHNIRVYGRGIVGGLISQEGNFMIDTSTAGIAKLDFEVLGPCGGFNAQLRQHWENERVLLARYDPTLPGVYHLVIRWAGIEIPGSPFTVRISDLT